MPAKTIAIIGGGIAGLAAGCYAQMNGYRTTIFELHDLPGGLCTAWERKGFTFDGCIHYLYGSGPGQPFHQLWQELGVAQAQSFIDHDEFLRVVGPDGRTFIVYCDPQRLAEHMKTLSPADAPLIDALAQGVRQFTRFDMSRWAATPRSLMGPAEGLAIAKAMWPFVRPLLRWGNVSAQEFGARFKDPFLRRAVPLMFNWPEIPMMAGLAQLAYMHTSNAGFPTGGSLTFAQAIERRYRALGGDIRYLAQVEQILVKRHCAVGVRLYNDEVYEADYVISAADGDKTIFGMLNGAYATRALRRRYDGCLPVHTMVQVSLGVDHDFSAEPHWMTYLLEEPVLIAGAPQPALGVKHYCFDPSLAPPGQSALEVMLPSPYHYWQRIYGRRLYKSEQEQVADQVLSALEQRYPGLTAQVEVVDVATPLSYERYTGNWHGSTCGWLLTKQTMGLMLRGVPKTLPRLANFFMAGQWVEPGGSVPLAAMSGHNAVQLICRQDGRPFVVEKVDVITTPAVKPLDSGRVAERSLERR
jgi:phytoene dehydrogenase-like protein